VDKQTALEIFGLIETALDENILRGVYLDLAKQHHPDREGGDAKRFRNVVSAYEYLRASLTTQKIEPKKPAKMGASLSEVDFENIELKDDTIQNSTLKKPRHKKSSHKAAIKEEPKENQLIVQNKAILEVKQTLNSVGGDILKLKTQYYSKKDELEKEYESIKRELKGKVGNNFVTKLLSLIAGTASAAEDRLAHLESAYSETNMTIDNAYYEEVTMIYGESLNTMAGIIDQITEHKQAS
jgi:curved DNA-binding protein CbpA